MLSKRWRKRGRLAKRWSRLGWFGFGSGSSVFTNCSSYTHFVKVQVPNCRTSTLLSHQKSQRMTDRNNRTLGIVIALLPKPLAECASSSSVPRAVVTFLIGPAARHRDRSRPLLPPPPHVVIEELSSQGRCSIPAGRRAAFAPRSCPASSGLISFFRLRSERSRCFDPLPVPRSAPRYEAVSSCLSWQ